MHYKTAIALCAPMTGNAKEIGRDIPRFVTQCIAFIDEHARDRDVARL